MHSPNFRPWNDLGHPSVELGLEVLCFIQGSMSYVFYGSLAVLIWKCGFQLGNWKVLFNFENSV